MFKFGESGHPVFRATNPLSSGQLRSKDGGNLSIHYCADLETIKAVFRTITSVNQLSRNVESRRGLLGDTTFSVLKVEQFEKT